MILTYASRQNWMASLLAPFLKEDPYFWGVEYCDSIVALESRLRRPHFDIQLILTCIGTAPEIMKLTELRNLLLDMKLIIGLPYRNNLMAHWASKLAPRFIAYAGDDDIILQSVIKKILHNLNPLQSKLHRYQHSERAKKAGRLRPAFFYVCQAWHIFLYWGKIVPKSCPFLSKCQQQCNHTRFLARQKTISLIKELCVS